MDIIRVVFQGGIELTRMNGAYLASNCLPPGKLLFQSLAEAKARLYPLRRILVTQCDSQGQQFTILLRNDGRTTFAGSISGLMNRPLSVDSIFPVYNLAYLVGAVGYHCQRLAELYIQITASFIHILQIPGNTFTSDSKSFGYQQEPYYEFDSIISAARRSFDSMRFPLWKCFGAGRGSIPRSLASLLESALALPERLRCRLNQTWQRVGIPLTEYRDCIQHYVPVDFGMVLAHMELLPVDLWSTRIFIPDNPGVRSKELFTYTRRIDALEYSYEVANELLDLTVEVVNATIPNSAT